jgi:hypothetical protein
VVIGDDEMGKVMRSGLDDSGQHGPGITKDRPCCVSVDGDFKGEDEVMT